MRKSLWSVLALTGALALPLVTIGCQTGQPGVKTTGVVQYTTVPATLEETTKVAAEVLEDMNMQNVSSDAGVSEGWAKGYLADGKEIEVELTSAGKDVTDVSVQVGTFGDTSLGKEIIARIRKELTGEEVASR